LCSDMQPACSAVVAQLCKRDMAIDCRRALATAAAAAAAAAAGAASQANGSKSEGTGRDVVAPSLLGPLLGLACMDNRWVESHRQ
jgi:hypothetical protein